MKPKKPYSLSDTVSPIMAQKTQMRFGSLDPASEAMSYLRSREEQGDFTFMGFVESATRSLVAEISIGESGDDRFVLSIPFENNEAYCSYMIESHDLGYGPRVIETDGYATICEIVYGYHIDAHDIDADFVRQIHRQAHLRTSTGEEPEFRDFMRTTILRRLDHDYKGSVRCDARDAAIDYFMSALERAKKSGVVRAHGDLSVGNVFITDTSDRPQLIDPNPTISPFEVDLGRIFAPAIIAGVRDFVDAEFSEIEDTAKRFVESLGLPRRLLCRPALVDSIVGVCATVLLCTSR